MTAPSFKVALLIDAPSAVAPIMWPTSSPWAMRWSAMMLPVAAPPHRLRAHDGSRGVGGLVAQFGQRVREFFPEGVVGVVVEAAVAPVAVDLEGHGARDVAAAGEPFAAAVHDAAGGQVRGEVVVVEPRVLAGPGEFAHVNDGLHPGGRKHRGEVVEVEVGVAHGVNAHADHATPGGVSHPHRCPGVLHRWMVGRVKRGVPTGVFSALAPALRGIDPAHGRVFRRDRLVEFERVIRSPAEP